MRPIIETARAGDRRGRAARGVAASGARAPARAAQSSAMGEPKVDVPREDDRAAARERLLAEVAALPNLARRLPLLRCRRPRALRRQGTRPEEARLELLHQAPRRQRRRDLDRPHGRPDLPHGDDGGALGGRGAAAREQPDQGAGAALQHPLRRRQELSLPQDRVASLSARRLLPRRGRPEAPLLRPVPDRLGGEGLDPADPEGVPPAHLRGHGVRQPDAAVPALPDQALLGPVRRLHLARGLRARRRQRRALPARRAAGADGLAAGADDGARRGAAVRAGGRDQEPDRLAVARPAPAGGRGQHRRAGGRHRHPRGQGRRRPRLRQPGDGPRRTPPRRSALLSEARRERDRRRRRGCGRRGRGRRRKGRPRGRRPPGRPRCASSRRSSPSTISRAACRRSSSSAMPSTRR